MDTLQIHCWAGKVDVTIGDVFKWDGLDPGTYTVKRWGNSRIYSPSGLGGTITVWVEDEKGEEIEWCGDSVASGIFQVKNPNHFRK
jgi:hypothetical protein